MPCVLRVRLAACRGAVSFATRHESSKGFLVWEEQNPNLLHVKKRK